MSKEEKQSENNLLEKLAITFLITFTGCCLKLPGIRNLDKDEHHDDEVFWETPEPEVIRVA